MQKNQLLRSQPSSKTHITEPTSTLVDKFDGAFFFWHFLTLWRVSDGAAEKYRWSEKGFAQLGNLAPAPLLPICRLAQKFFPVFSPAKFS